MEYEFLAHHGIKGQKWGVRKYQNSDGSLTALGRIRYGVGSAKEAIRKKVKPTNAELNAQIRKQRSKNLNKQKKQQLKNLKKGIDTDSSAGSSKEKIRGQHKRFSEMSDVEIANRIKRLESEIKLAELERTKSMGPGMRMVDSILKEAGKESAKRLLTSAITQAGEKAIKNALDSTSKSEQKQQKSDEKKKQYESELAEKKAKADLDKYNKENPTGLGKLSPSSRKAAQERKEREAQEKADKKLEEEAKRSKNRQTLIQEKKKKQELYSK